MKRIGQEKRSIERTEDEKRGEEKKWKGKKRRNNENEKENRARCGPKHVEILKNNTKQYEVTYFHIKMKKNISRRMKEKLISRLRPRGYWKLDCRLQADGNM